MPARFSVCIEMIFADLPFLDRIESVARAGFPAFEFWGWGDRDLEALKVRMDAGGLALAAMSCSSRQGAVRQALRPQTGGLVDAADHDDYLRGVEESIRVAQDLGCPSLILLSGNTKSYLTRDQQRHNLVAGLSTAAHLAEGTGVTLLLEPLNSLVDHRGYFLTSSQEAFAIVREVGSPTLKVLFDVYHQQVSEGNITANLQSGLDLVGHVHVADVPGRHQPGTGEINYRYLFNLLDSVGYEGFVGLEYRPLGTAEESLAQVRDLDGGERGDGRMGVSPRKGTLYDQPTGKQMEHPS